MVENMFFLDSEHAGMGGMLLSKKGYLVVYVTCLVSKNYFTRLWLFLLQLLLGMQPKSKNKISLNSKDSFWYKFYVVLLDIMFSKWWSSQKLIKFPICHWKSFFVLDVTLWDQFIKFLIKLLTFNDFVSLFMAIMKILCGIDKNEKYYVVFF